VGVERRGAVGAHDAQVFDAVVIGHPVDVVEDQAHPPAPPELTLSAQLADGLLEPGLVEALLEVIASEARMLDEDLLQ
jgi:hypothetical protein